MASKTPISKTPITVAYGDGIGPEIMEATLRILDGAGAQLEIETIDIGEKLYLTGNTSGIAPESWESLLRTKVLLKAPITTPQGGGVKSLNVTIRKTLGLYANVRPCVSYYPYVATKQPKMDMVIIRENEEDLYAGIEYRQTYEVYECVKVISRPGCERIIRYAFEYARTHNRKKVTCITKDNIMKLTDGLFHKVFDEIKMEYPAIETDHLILDIGAARISDTPDQFDVVVTLNLYGDVISDIAAQVAGSVGLAGSANIGEHCAMFEAIHGSAPPLAGRNLANPSGLLNGAIMMLAHIGQPEVATKVHNAWLKTLEDGIHTGEIHSAQSANTVVGTKEFADAVIERLGQKPHILRPVQYSASQAKEEHKAISNLAPPKKEMVGVDVFLHWPTRNPEEVGTRVKQLENDKLKLVMISNRGVKVWPGGSSETFCADEWRCRFAPASGTISHNDIITLLQSFSEARLDFIKFESLCNFDGKPGYVLAQGQ